MKTMSMEKSRIMENIGLIDRSIRGAASIAVVAGVMFGAISGPFASYLTLAAILIGTSAVTGWSLLYALLSFDTLTKHDEEILEEEIPLNVLAFPVDDTRSNESEVVPTKKAA